MVELQVLRTVQVRIDALDVCEDAIANSKIGEKLTFRSFDSETNGLMIIVYNEADEAIGRFPEDDSLYARLVAGEGYKAVLGHIVRGRSGQRFKRLILEVSTSGGSLSV